MTGADNYPHDEHVSAGLKATMKNPNVSNEAKQRASERLKESGSSSSGAQSRSQGSGLHSDDAHDHHVMGGYKATLKNPRVSDEAKESAREKLDQYDK